MLTKLNIFIVALSAAMGFSVGFIRDNSVSGGFSTLFLTALLAALEITFSFDNAVVNATILRQMTPKWRHRFMTWGIALAVFGMRLIFPVAVVSCVGGMWPWQAIRLALFDAPNYVRIMSSAQLSLAGFGGIFLSMAALNFFVDPEKEEHWLKPVEGILARMGRAPYVAILTGLALTYGVSFLPATVADQSALFKSGIFGVAAFLAVQCIGGILQMPAKGRIGLERASAALFVYLEVLDASCSFDSVIGAFALTNNLLIIAAGLGVGAMVVRGLTSALVERNTLENFKFLEHGAYYAIGALGVLMLVNTAIPIPGVVIGLTGAAVICASIVASAWQPEKIRASLGHALSTVGSVVLSLSLINGMWGLIRSSMGKSPRAAVVAEVGRSPLKSTRIIRSGVTHQNKSETGAATLAVVPARMAKGFSQTQGDAARPEVEDRSVPTLELPVDLATTSAVITADQLKSAVRELQQRLSVASSWIELSREARAKNLMQSARRLLNSIVKRESVDQALHSQTRYFSEYGALSSNSSVERLNNIFRDTIVQDFAPNLDHPALIELTKTLLDHPWGTLLQASRSAEMCSLDLIPRML